MEDISKSEHSVSEQLKDISTVILRTWCIFIRGIDRFRKPRALASNPSAPDAGWAGKEATDRPVIPTYNSRRFSNILGCFRRIWLGRDSCSLFPIQSQSQPTKKYLLRGKNGPNTTLENLIFPGCGGGLGLQEFCRFHNNIDTFSNPT